MKKTSFLILATVLFFACDNSNKNETSNKTGSDSARIGMDTRDTTNSNSTAPEALTAESFVSKAAMGGMMEVQAAKIASKKGTSKEVKDMAKMIMTDHAKANEELKALAKKKNIAVPDSLNEEMKTKITNLQSTSGTEFDKAYADMMVNDHNEDIPFFERASKEISDPDIQKWAAGKTETLKHHLHMAEEAQKKLSASK